MLRFVLFSGTAYSYGFGGMGAYVGAYATLEDALAADDPRRDDWAEVAEITSGGLIKRADRDIYKEWKIL